MDLALGRDQNGANATVCIDECPIPGSTNEMGTVCGFVEDMLSTYRHTALFELITTDAGNTSQALAAYIHSQTLGYFLAIKKPQGDIFREALRLLDIQAQWEETRREKGHNVTYRLFRASIDGYLQWTHARQFVRLQRVVRDAQGQTVSIGDRYFVTNLPSARLQPKALGTLVRLHWRCENCGHWTVDTLWKEDAKRTPWTQNPKAIFVTSLIRMLALNIVAVIRSMSRRENESGKVPWNTVLNDIHVALRSPDTTSVDRYLLN